MLLEEYLTAVKVKNDDIKICIGLLFLENNDKSEFTPKLLFTSLSNFQKVYSEVDNSITVRTIGTPNLKNGENFDSYGDIYDGYLRFSYKKQLINHKTVMPARIYAPTSNQNSKEVTLSDVSVIPTEYPGSWNKIQYPSIDVDISSILGNTFDFDVNSNSQDLYNYSVVGYTKKYSKNAPITKDNLFLDNIIFKFYLDKLPRIIHVYNYYVIKKYILNTLMQTGYRAKQYPEDIVFNMSFAEVVPLKYLEVLANIDIDYPECNNSRLEVSETGDAKADVNQTIEQLITEELEHINKGRKPFTDKM